MYVFRDTEPEFWQQIMQLREQYNFKLLWEIDASVAVRLTATLAWIVQARSMQSMQDGTQLVQSMQVWLQH